MPHPRPGRAGRLLPTVRQAPRQGGARLPLRVHARLVTLLRLGANHPDKWDLRGLCRDAAQAIEQLSERIASIHADTRAQVREELAAWLKRDTATAPTHVMLGSFDRDREPDPGDMDGDHGSALASVYGPNE